MTPHQPLDFAQTWQDYAQHNMRERLSDVGEIDFWARNAAGYDAGNKAQPASYRETLEVIRALVMPQDTLLDVGAGSGRFALPLAQDVRAITALDLSPHMLSILRETSYEQGLTNITAVESSWEDAVVTPHDVVLAAWSMYRQRDILASLQKLIEATKRVLIIVDGDYAPRPENDPPHERLRTDIWGAGDPGICNYLYFAGMLRQLRIRADVRVVHEEYTQTADSLLALARSFAPQSATPDSIETYAHRLSPYVRQTAEGCLYTCRFAVGLVIWQRNSNISSQNLSKIEGTLP